MATFFQNVKVGDEIKSNIYGNGLIKNKYIDLIGCYVVEVYFPNQTKIFRYNLNGISFNYIDEIKKI